MMNKKFLVPLLSIALLASCGGNPSTTDTSSVEETAPNSEVKDYDVVAETKLNISDELFARVMMKKTDKNFEADKLDFNTHGIERMLTNTDYLPNSQKDVFTNYVDGDTTSFTTYNGVYGVKVRYLAIDTPESTSEIEEWGKSASLENEETLKNAKHIILQSAGCAKTGQEAPADLDTYQRTLAYVWYSNVENPTKDDFRNLNLETVYKGFSTFSGALEDMSVDFYKAFMDANDIARKFKKKIYSNETDPNYYYGDPQALGLDALYNPDLVGKDGLSVYCDEYTRWTFEGVVSRKVGNAFYIQDTIDGKTYGLYIFTLRTYAPVQVGKRLKVTGVLSYYGGVYELSGVSWSMFNPTKYDIQEVVDKDGNPVVEEVVPIKASCADIKAGKYDCVLVEMEEAGTDNTLYFNTTLSEFKGTVTSYAYGGEEEVNTYNETHPFYNTSNDMIFFGRWGKDMENVSEFTSFVNDENLIRIKLPDAVRVSDKETDQTIVSYKYFTGTKDINGNEAKYYYVPKDNSKNNVTIGQKVYDLSTLPDPTKSSAAQLSIDLTNKVVTEDAVKAAGVKFSAKTFQRKKITSPIGIAQNYVSTSGNAMYSLNLCDANDIANLSAVEAA